MISHPRHIRPIYVPPVSPAVGRDARLLFPVLFLVGIGLVMVYSASSALAQEHFGSDTHFLRRQAVFFALGLVGLFAARRFPLRWLRKLAYPLLALSLLLLMAVFFPALGKSAGGATRWLRVGSFTFQPAELARFSLVLYLAYSLSKKGFRVRDFSIGVAPHVVALGLLAIPILLQPDFGSATLLTVVGLGMLFLGGIPIRHLLGSIAVLAPLAVFFVAGTPYRMRRILSFWDPWAYAKDEGYQVVHSLMAFGSGGWWGVGLGNSHQKLFYLPEPHTDFIFSVVGEELGLLGVVAVLLGYGMIIRGGLAAARRAEDGFRKLLAAGLTLSLGLQAMINMAVTLALVPTKGLTLPFLSYGGTSLVVSMISVGFLMNVDAVSLHERSD
ncbi:MAG: putative lipid II flippase FtsW [Desulfococcaceae bacterium]